MNWILVALGGALGAVSRYGITLVTDSYFKSNLISILLVNILGSIILGLFIGYSLNKQTFSSEYNLFLAIGFLASFTTFSTITVNTIQLASEGEYLKASINIIATLILGLIAAFIGLYLGKIISP